MSNLNPEQFIPEKYTDWAWEITLQPELDREYTRKDGSPELVPGHLHFDENANPHIASGLCKGKHGCPPETKKMREMLAIAKWQKDMGAQ